MWEKLNTILLQSRVAAHACSLAYLKQNVTFIQKEDFPSLSLSTVFANL